MAFLVRFARQIGSWSRRCRASEEQSSNIAPWMMNTSLGGFKCFFYVHPEPWANDPIWRSYFSIGLNPPTRSLTMFFQRVWGRKLFGKSDFDMMRTLSRYANRDATNKTGVQRFFVHVPTDMSHSLKKFPRWLSILQIGARINQSMVIWLVIQLSGCSQLDAEITMKGNLR